MSRPTTVAKPHSLDCAPLQSARSTEFINNYYALSQEPLNLRATGQKWFSTIYCREHSPQYSTGLVLGGTPWIGSLLMQELERVIMVDVNPAMLETAAKEIQLTATAPPSRVDYVCANWLSMPDFPTPIDVVVGDNCMNFLKYPEGWSHFFANVIPRLSPKAKVMIRFMSIPPTHRASTIDEIVADYSGRDSVNYTQVRAHLLLSHWEPRLMAVRTEEVVKVFDANESKFEPLFRKFGKADNDLTTIRKFRNSGFVSYAPPLEDILSFLAVRLQVTDIHFGPYGLAEYFPLIVAQLR